MKRLMCAAMAGITALTSIVMTVPAAAEEKVQDNEKTIDEKHLRVLFFINKWVTK